MPHALNGLRVVSFESRRAAEMAELIRNYGGEPIQAPSMREVPPSLSHRSRGPGCGRVRAGPSHRHARRAAGDRGPWVSLPLRATIPEGNTVGQHADVDVGP